MAIYAATIDTSGTTKNANVLKMATSFQVVYTFSSALKMASSQDNTIPAKILTVGKKKFKQEKRINLVRVQHLNSLCHINV